MCGWATINFIDLQQENTTFPTGPLTLEEATLVTSLTNIGGFIGNFAILPLSDKFGMKRAIHLAGIPLVVSSIEITHYSVTIQLINYENFILVKLHSNSFCVEQILCIYVTSFEWFYWWRTCSWHCIFSC